MSASTLFDYLTIYFVEHHMLVSTTKDFDALCSLCERLLLVCTYFLFILMILAFCIILSLRILFLLLTTPLGMTDFFVSVLFLLLCLVLRRLITFTALVEKQ